MKAVCIKRTAFLSKLLTNKKCEYIISFIKGKDGAKYCENVLAESAAKLEAVQLHSQEEPSRASNRKESTQ